MASNSGRIPASAFLTLDFRCASSRKLIVSPPPAAARQRVNRDSDLGSLCFSYAFCPPRSSGTRWRASLAFRCLPATRVCELRGSEVAFTCCRSPPGTCWCLVGSWDLGYSPTRAPPDWTAARCAAERQPSLPRSPQATKF